MPESCLLWYPKREGSSMRRSNYLQVYLPKSLLRRLERVAPCSLRGRRKHRVRVEYVLERFVEAESAGDGKLAKAG